MKLLSLAGLSGLLLAFAPPAHALSVIFQYEARVATVASTPLGISPALGTLVTGFFQYESTTPDTNAVADRGDYPHASGGAFSATVQGHGITITGSETPFAQVENLSSDTFRFIDGPRPVGPEGGVLSVNGVADADVDLLLAITDGSAAAFADDDLPTVFPLSGNPWPGFPHTFSLSDDGGTLLLQFNRVTQVPEPATGALALAGLAALAFVRRRRQG